MAETLPVAIGQPSLPSLRFESALSSAVDYAANEKAESTRRGYERDLVDFAAWCDVAGRSSMPADIATVAAYLASLADKRLSYSTVNRRAAAIAFAHRRAGCDSPTTAEPVRATMRGIRRTIGTAVHPKAPATAKVIAAITKRMPETLAGKRDRALLLLCFAAALRRSELVALNVNDIERAPEGIIVHVRRSKTDQEGVGHAIAVPNGRKLRAIEALDAWLAAAAIVEGAIFRRIRKGGAVGDRLTGHAVAVIVKRWAKAAKLDPNLFSGHSARAGFVTSALEAGADLLKVMDVTRHREMATLRRYDRRAKAFLQHAGKDFL